MTRFLQCRRPTAVLSLALVLAAAAAAVPAVAAPPGASTWPDWTTFQGNSAHTGYVPARLDPAKFTTRWQIPISTVQGGLTPGVASMATSNGLVYVSGGNRLDAYREADGSAVWSHDFSDLPFPSVNPPALSKGVVYVAAGQQDSTFLFAFDAATGAAVFQSPMSSQWENYLAPTVGAYGIYTNAGTYGGLYAFARNGKQRFVAYEAQQSLWTPAVDATGVYSYTGNLQVVDPQTGVVTHTIADDTFQNYTYLIGGSPVLGAPGSVFVANYANAPLNGGAIGNTLLNFSTLTDSIAWKVAGDYPTTPAYAAGRLYAVNNGPLRLEVRSEADGTLAWQWTPPAGNLQFVSEVLLTDNLVFVSTDVATFAISLKTHKAVWSCSSAGKLALSRSGILYIQGSTTLTAFNAK